MMILMAECMLWMGEQTTNYGAIMIRELRIFPLLLMLMGMETRKFWLEQHKIGEYMRLMQKTGLCSGAACPACLATFSSALLLLRMLIWMEELMLFSQTSIMNGQAMLMFMLLTGIIISNLLMN